MDWQSIIIALITGCIPAVIGYFVSRNNTKSQIAAIKIETDAQINAVKISTDAQIKALESNHAHEIEIMNLKFDQDTKTQSTDVTNQMMQSMIKTPKDIMDFLSLAESFGADITGVFNRQNDE